MGVEPIFSDWKSDVITVIPVMHIKITLGAKDSKQLMCLLPFGNPALIRHKLSFVIWLPHHNTGI